VKYNYMATCPARLDNAESYARVDSLFRQLEHKGTGDLRADGFAPDRISCRRSLDMRYVGQVHECTVDIDSFTIDETTILRVKDAFH
ncbi:hypothetical protein, partial [Klebsiella pneumoniae]